MVRLAIASARSSSAESTGASACVSLTPEFLHRFVASYEKFFELLSSRTVTETAA